MVSHQIEFGWKGITSAEDTVETIIWPHILTLTLKIAKHFVTCHRLIMMHFHTFGYKRLYRSEDIIRVNSQWHFEPLLTLTLNTAKHTFHKTLGNCGSWWCIIVPSSVTKVSAVQRIPSGQTLNWILNHYCDLDNSTFSKYVLAYGGLPTNYVRQKIKKQQQKTTTKTSVQKRYWCTVDIVEIVILCLNKPL